VREPADDKRALVELVARSRRNLVTLVASGKRLSPHMRVWLAAELERLYFETPAKARRDRQRREAIALLDVVAEIKDRLKIDGVKGMKADEAVAKIFGVDVQTLHKRVYRARQRARD
jgi:hypothetical protein